MIEKLFAALEEPNKIRKLKLSHLPVNSDPFLTNTLNDAIGNNG